MSTAIAIDPQFWKHDTGYHPESSERLTAIMDRLKKTNYYPQLITIPISPANQEDITRIHTTEYFQYFLKTTSERKSGFFDGDTPFSEGSKDAAFLAAGAGISVANEILSGKIKNGFAIVRPPGHHAEVDRAMGFCMFNNIAITARYLQSKGIQKILILDWDVHHGNGTEHTFYSDNTVFFMSIHQYPFYPGTGAAKDKGEKEGYGYNLNMPVPRGANDFDYYKLFDNLILKEIEKFHPDFILISAGFDAHKKDPLGGVELTTGAYEQFTTIIKKVAEEYCYGRIISMLEGGYNLEALAESAEVHLSVLVG